MSNTQFHVNYAARLDGRIAIVTMDNGEDHRKPTTFGEEALRSLSDALEELEAVSDLRGVLLTGKPHVFAAGADLQAFVGMNADRARQAGRLGHEAFARLQQLPVPTLAAINGVCMGGGLEIALHCDARTISSSARAVAFPEVFLSIFPAWGGTQLAPRLVGAKNAVDTIVVNALANNRVMRPTEVLERGYADVMLEPATFVDDSLSVLDELITGERNIERTVDIDDGLDEALANGRASADGRTHGATRAPYVALDLIEFAARGGDLDEGREREQQLLSELLPARQAQASVYSFDLVNNRVKRQVGKPDVAPRPIAKMAIVGGGLMGAQLAALHVQRLEVPLVVKDIDESVLQRCRQHIDDALDKRVAQGRLTEGKARFLKGLVTTTMSYDDLAGADWVMEAVLEELDLKKMILHDIEHVVDDTCVIATNTSSLSVDAMASDMRLPQRLVGLHFFNPVAVLPLVEVVRPPQASDEAMATAFEVAKRLKKSAVACIDAPGFIVNRLLLRFNAAAAGALKYGTDFKAIDTAIKNLGLPMGPFELFGLIGLKVSYHVARSLADAFPDRFEVDENFQLLGDSNLDGVYDWTGGGEVYPQLRDQVVVVEDTPWDEKRIQQVALEATADEIAHMLSDGVVDDPRDIDTAMLLGAGWPFFNGGACPYLDATGISQRIVGRQLLAG